MGRTFDHRNGASPLEQSSLYDAALKATSLAQGSTFLTEIASKICGIEALGRVLGTEFPRTPKLLADLLVEANDGRVLHVEFQSTNDPTMHWRMLEYYGEIIQLHGSRKGDGTPEVAQVVIYVGQARMRMRNQIGHANLQYRFHVRDIRDFSEAAGELSQEDAPVGDWILSLLCQRIPDPREWHRMLQRATKLRESEARHLVFWMWVAARLRELPNDLRVEIEDMAIRLDVSDDPVFRPALDRAETRGVLKVVCRIMEARKVSLDEDQAEALASLPYDDVHELAIRCYLEEPSSVLAEVLRRRAPRF